MQLKNDRLIKALFRQTVDRTPIWLMRQAGRYLPEYRELRKKAADFMTFCKNPQLACEATLQPLKRFDLDAAIIFSDILTVPEAMGMEIYFQNGEGPVLPKPIQSLEDVEKLKIPAVSSALGYVMEAIQLTLSALKGQVPLIGFAGSPWTLATYMFEGGGSKNFRRIRSLCYQDPALVKALLNKLTQVTGDYLLAQAHAGAQVLMIFDSWGGILSPSDYQQFSLSYMQTIAQRLKPVLTAKKIPLIFFSKGANHSLELIANSGCNTVGLDWTINIGEARRRVGHLVSLQGNLDPFILFAKPEKIQREVEKILSDFGAFPGHVFNLGHGIDLETPIENVNVLIKAVNLCYHPLSL